MLNSSRCLIWYIFNKESISTSSRVIYPWAPWKCKDYFTGCRRFSMYGNPTRSITFSCTFVRILVHFCCSMQQPFDYQLQKSIWHMQMSLFCLLLPAWCLIIFGTKLLHICAWPHFWFMKQLISLVNLHGKLFIAFMVYSAHRIQQPIFKTTNPECSRFSDCFWQKKREKKNIGRKIRERSEAQFRNWLLDPAIQIYTKYISSRPMNLTILSRKVKWLSQRNLLKGLDL